MIIECIIELNWLCKHIKKLRSSQPAILVLNWLKHSFSRWVSLKLNSHLPKKSLLYLLQWKPFKNYGIFFYFVLKALFVLKVLKFLSWLFGQVEKRLDYKYTVNFWRYKLINKYLQYKYCPISQKLKETRQWNLFS